MAGISLFLVEMCQGSPLPSPGEDVAGWVLVLSRCADAAECADESAGSTVSCYQAESADTALHSRQREGARQEAAVDRCSPIVVPKRSVVVHSVIG